MQQFCGVNAIAYYSSNVFAQADFTDVQALLASWGFGLTNWLFAFPALYSIDRFGRRKLLLTSYPFMSIFLLMTGLGFLITQREPKIAVIATGIYMFTIAYSPGAGPVPFVASCFFRALSLTMSGSSFRSILLKLTRLLSETLACLCLQHGYGSCKPSSPQHSPPSISLTLFFLISSNFVVAITFPPLIGAFTATGAFGWYAGWNFVGFVSMYFLVPETKGRTLEELDEGAQPPPPSLSHPKNLILMIIT